MNVERWQKIKELFYDALEQPPAAREKFLRENCADESLRNEVAELLAAHSFGGNVIEELAASAISEVLADESASLVGKRIGNYKIIREIGRGGMGAVYLAERTDGEFEQKVALKIIKRGTDTDEILRRFRLERQILAELNHPFIARLFDGGTTADGLPYFVMEYVEGLPLNRFCTEKNLDIKARLELFRQVCAAVQYAHQHLIIHRDIKPSNILVTDEGTPKLLDFGIAKLLKEQSGGETQTRHFAFTPEYASPEQLRGERVTTASDIYSLGVVLAELIRGYEQTHSKLRLSSKKTEDQRPKSDLQAILQTALREEPELRYSSVAQLSEDINRYLQGLPVVAQKDSFAYRAKKFIRRNKIAVGAGASILTAIAIGIISTLRQSRIASRERDKAKLEAARAEKINLFLQEMLSAADPRAKGKDVKVAEILDLAAQRIEIELAEQPEISADLQTTIGLTYLGLGLFEKAEKHLREALEIRLQLCKNRSSAVSGQGIEEAEAQTIAASFNNLGKVLQAKGAINEAETLFRQALRLTSDENNLLTAEILHNLGGLFLLKGEHEKAVKAHRKEIAIRREILGDTHALVAESLKDLAVVLGTMGKLDEAERLHRESLSILQKIYQDEHPDIASAMTTLASAVEHKNAKEAEQLFQQALAMRRRLLGDQHPDVAWTLYNFAYLLFNQKRFAEAMEMTNQVLAMRGSVLPNEHILINSCLQLVGLCLMKQGKAEEAEDFLRECLTLRQKTLPPDHWLTASAKSILGECLAMQERFDEAQVLLSESYEKLKEIFGEAHERTQEAEQRLSFTNELVHKRGLFTGKA